MLLYCHSSSSYYYYYYHYYYLQAELSEQCLLYYVVAEFLEAVYRKQRLLVTAPSNVAVDNLLELKIHQRGVQWKQGAVICMVLHTSLPHDTTPFHCTPLPLHPPVMNTHPGRLRLRL